MKQETLPHVVIVGAGFAGLTAAQKLAHKAVRVTVVDRRNYHLFQPLLYQVATAGLSPDEIAYPVRAIFQSYKNIDFFLAEVINVDFKKNTLQTSRGPLAYDMLILAAGATVNYFGNDLLAEKALILKDVPDAVALRNQILKMFELASHESDEKLRRAKLTFLVAGGGPTGVESAGAFTELIHLVLRKDYPKMDINDVQVILLEANDHLLNGFPSDLQANALKTLRAKGVTVKVSARVASFNGEQARLESGEVIPSYTLLWSAGVQAAELYDHLNLEQGRQGRVKVLPTLQVAEHENVLIAGDGAYLEKDGQPMPMMGTVAFQQGTTAAENVLRLLVGGQAQPFKYQDPGSLATIGRNAAVARIGRWQFSGFLAWVVWLVVHLIGLIGFRNRLIVLINWAWDYFFYDRAVRLITRE